MAIKIGANLAYNGKLPNFERDSFDTKAAMKAFNENSIDEGHLSYCKEDGNIYQYKSANTADATTGKWRLFKTKADAILNGTSTNAIQNKAVFDALKLKADTVALGKYQPKYNADYIAKNDLTEIPITEGIIDLNGHMLDMSSINNEAVSLTIMNGCIRFTKDVVIKLSTLIFNNITIEDALGSVKKIQISVDTLEFINVISYTREAFNMSSDDSISGPSITKVYNSSIAGVITGYIMYLYQSAVNLINPDSSHGIKLFAFNSYFNDEGASLEKGSEWYNCHNGFSWVTSGCLNEKGEEENYNRFVPSIKQIYKDSENAPQTKAVYNALQLKADKTSLAGYQPKYKADYVATKDFNYSELPESANVIDLNGYKMTTNENVIVSGLVIYNGYVELGNNNEVDSCYLYYININCSNNDFKYQDIDSIYYYCNIKNINVTSAADIYFSNVSDVAFSGFESICYSNISYATFAMGEGEGVFGYNVSINGISYKKCYIKNNTPLEQGFESNIDNPTTHGNAPSCEAVNAKFANYATKTELNNKADTSALNNYLTNADASNRYLTITNANTTYAKKSDITNIYKFKGTKTNYADLPTTDRVTGDVWNITNANAEYGIKAGDNVAWNGDAWDNLSGTVDLSAYATTTTTDAMSADIKKLMDKAFPFTVKVSIDKTLAKKGTSQPVKVTITPKIGDDNTNVDAIMINGEEHHGAIPYVYSTTATTTTTYNVRADKTDRNSAHGSATITFVNPSYDGAVAANFTVTEANIKALTETLRSGKGGTRTFNLNNQKACIAYPKDFGAATGIKDANGFDYLASYTRSELSVNGELYYVYLLTNAATITDMKQIIS